jgi:hypothetical protein
MKLDETTHDSRPAPIGFVADALSAARALVGQPTVALVPILLCRRRYLAGTCSLDGARRPVRLGGSAGVGW